MNGQDTVGTIELDLKGLKCPLPALRTGKALDRLEAGTRLIVLATDPMSEIDIPHAVQQRRAVLVEMRREAGDVLVFVIERD